MNKEQYYFRLPFFFQHLAVSAVGFQINQTRYDQNFKRLLDEYENRLEWDRADIFRYRDQQLQQVLQQAYNHTAYYRVMFDRYGTKPEEIKRLEDLKRLPILTKQDVRVHSSEMLSDAVESKKRVMEHTSGTTGTGLHFPTTKQAQQEQWAVWWRYRRYHGIQRGTLCAYFGGQSIVDPDQKEPPYWRYDLPGRRILFSVYHINRDRIKDYLSELRRRQPPWIHGYPSVIALLAAYLLETGEDLGYPVSWVTTGSENLLAHQAEMIQKVFGVKPIQNYGLAEGTANFSQCRARSLHVDEDYAAVEFIPDQDRSGYRVIGTSLSNLALPMIRYDTGDLVQLADQPCECGLPGRVVSAVDGRREDYVLLRDGTKIGRLDHIFKDLIHIQEAQIHQQEPGRITLRIVPSEGYTAEDQIRLENEIRSRLGERLSVDIVTVKELQRSPAGKLRLVVSELEQGKINEVNL